MSLARHTPTLGLVLALGCSVLPGTDPDRTRGVPDDATTSQSGDERAVVCDTGAALLDLLNHPTTTAGVLQVIGLHSRAASELVAWRNGDDGIPGTTDDRWFTNLVDVDAVPQVGEVAMAQIDAHAKRLCPIVVMSPQSYADSHIQLAIDAIERAEYSVDIAMYSFRDDGVMSAIQGALDRDLPVRVVYHGAADDRRDPAGTRSAALEDMGAEVRWINKIMHHKFALIDGPHAHPYEAWRATVVTGSGNWSWSAATLFDENTVSLTGDPRLGLALQQEFNLLWENGRPVEWNEDIAEVPVITLTDEEVGAAPGSVVGLTSANFETYVSSRYGPTFTAIDGSRAVVDMLVGLISQADSTIDIASGHLRFKPVLDALIAQQVARPDLQIRVYLDGQEYTSEGYFESELEDYADCVELATTGEALTACEDEGAHYGYALHKAGIPIRYKYGSYRWDYRYAIQMHHKYMLIDGSMVASGSYNISPNAEYGTLENLVVYSAARYPELVQAFSANFEHIWETGRTEDLYGSLMNEIVSGTESTFPIVFEPMALSWDEVSALKNTIDAHCPEIDSWEYRSYPSSHKVCER